MRKDSRFEFILLVEFFIQFYLKLPHQYLYYHCNLTDYGATKKHSESTIEANQHCHVPSNLYFTKAESITDRSKMAIEIILVAFVDLYPVKIFNRFLYTSFIYINSVIIDQFHFTKLPFRGPPATA